MTEFWTKDPKVLLSNVELWPTPQMSLPEKLNAVTRTVVLLSLVGFVCTTALRFIWMGALTLIAVVAYEQSLYEKKEPFVAPLNLKRHTTPTKTNPMMNVLLPEINGNPNRKPALPSSHPETAQLIKEQVKQIGNIDPRLLKGTNSEMELDYSMRQFFSTASTTIPNDQEGFGAFCYGDMRSAKEGDEFALGRKNSRLGSIPT